MNTFNYNFLKTNQLSLKQSLASVRFKLLIQKTNSAKEIDTKNIYKVDNDQSRSSDPMKNKVCVALR